MERLTATKWSITVLTNNTSIWFTAHHVTLPYSSQSHNLINTLRLPTKGALMKESL